ncbi:transposase [candidate division WOR-3 bacterium]|nr:transposase [candidate division WOR-3 bacterium]
MQLTQKIRIMPTTEQECVLLDLSEKCRLIYNFALAERREAYTNGVDGITYIKQQNDLPKIKEEYPEYKIVNSKVLQYTLRMLDADYKSFYALKKKGDKDANSPKFKGKKYFTTMCFNQSGFSVKNSIVKLSHKHPSGVALMFSIPVKFSFSKIYQITIYKKDKDYYLSITHEQPEVMYEDNGLYQSFDLGIIKQTAVNMGGKFVEFANQRPDKYWEKAIAELQSRRDHCKKYSRRWHKLNKLHAKCKHKSANQMRDSQHKLSHKIVNNTKANTIIVGELSPKKMCQINKHQKGLHRSLQNTGSISRLTGFLTYKAKLVGKRVVEISEVNTSKICCVCGSKQDMPLSKRQYICDCGNDIDRDRNSSINIMLRYLSENGLWTSYWQFVSNLRQTGLAIVNHSQEAITSKPQGDLGYV